MERPPVGAYGGWLMASAPPPPSGFTLDSPPPPPPGFSVDGSPPPSALSELGAGFVKGVTGLSDAAEAIDPVNWALKGVDALAGTHLAHQPTQAALDRDIGKATGYNPDNTPETTTRDRILQGIGGGASGALIPGGDEMTVANMLRNGLVGAGAGAGATVAQEYAPAPLKPLAGLAGGIVAGMATHGAMVGAGTVADSLGSAAKSLADPIAAGFSQATAERVAANRIASSATDLPTVLDQLKQGAPELVPGSNPTLYQATGDTGIGSLERQTATANPAPFIDRETAQNTARIDALGDIQSNGDPMAVAGTLRDGLDALDHETSADVARATMAAQDRAEAVLAQSKQAIGGATTNAQEAAEATMAQSKQAIEGATTNAQNLAGAIPDVEPGAVGQSIRDAVEQAEQQASARARGLYNAIDPKGDLTANVQATSKAAQDIMANEPATAKPMGGEEAAIFDSAANMQPLSPARDIVALNQRVNAAMRSELMASGRTPTYARLSQLKSAIQDNLANTISQQVVHDNALVQQGVIAPENALAARIGQWRDEYQAAKQNGTFGQQGVGGPAGVQTVADAGVDGAGLSPSGRSGGPAGDQGVSGVSDGLTPTFDDEARGRLALANATYREKMGAYGRGPVSDIIRKAGMSDVYRIAPEAVPAKVWSKGPIGAPNVQALIKAVGAESATSMLSDVAAMSLRRAAMRDDGTLNPTAYSRWRNDYADALGALPADVRARFGAAAQASSKVAQTVAERAAIDKSAAKTAAQTIRDATAERAAIDKEAARTAAQTIREAESARVTQMQQAQRGAIGQIMGATDPSEVSKMVGGMLNRATGVTEMRNLVGKLKSDPVALDGLRQSIADHIDQKFISATNGEALKAAQFQTFLKDKRPALSQAFSPEQIDGMGKIAEDLKRSQLSQTGAKLKNGSSATAQDSLAARALGSTKLRSTLLELALAGGAGEETFGHLGGIASALGVVAVEALRSAGLRNINDLVTRAMLDPDFAKTLLEKLPATPTEKSSLDFARAAKRSAIAAGLSLQTAH